MRFLFCLAVLLLSAAASAQALPQAARAYLGDWTIVDETTNEAQAVVRITEARGSTGSAPVVEGRIVRLLPTAEYPRPAFVCADCEGQYRGVDLRQVLLIREMRWDGSRFSGGRIVDPEAAKTYRASLTLDGASRLRVRGYIGIPALGRTQVWMRAR